jgi:uncharacterized membrane protein YgcG
VYTKHTPFLALILSAVALIGFLHTRFINAADINATITTGIFAPGSPVNLAVTVGDTSVTLSWSVPATDGGSSITDYGIEYRLTSGGVWTLYGDSVTSNTSATVLGLGNDNAYSFRVYAINAIGQSPPSTEVSATPGSPAQVIVNSFSDLTIPTIAASVRITNEGSLPYEYQYTWCVTASDTNLCGGGDDVFSATAAKLIQSGENWDTTLPATVATAGTYWFHLDVAFGSDSSHASQSFEATRGSSGSSGGGGGGGGSSSSRTRQCVGADMNRDKAVNLIDFSILLLFFLREGPFTNPCVDINRDTKVNVVDFSILLSQWGKKPTVFVSAP